MRHRHALTSPTRASLATHFKSHLSFILASFSLLAWCVCFTLLCCSFPHSSPRFDMAASWNFQPYNPRYQKFIEPGHADVCKALRRSGSTPTLPSLPLFLSLVFCLLSSFPRTMSLFMLPARSLSPHFSHLTFHPPQLPQLLFHLSITPSVTVAIFSHRGRHATAVLSRSLPLSLSPSFSCRCLTLSTSR